ncbi:uncharacterized protein BJ212DRAFT_1305201 [Suillus subaureus]|uniref:Uncharacterized protein n=1 Tax=Suillus subaureus TaxID=48587 RepID=A0A9P7J388_9AGAM|nr:uncharacterized protein BJ212DRAFT_1305201 [Suillus subaureus]KAG1800725.1 hypothetical protein BJ212DRAFT_1305201 [Suillus subaureus]
MSRLECCIANEGLNHGTNIHREGQGSSKSNDEVKDVTKIHRQQGVEVMIDPHGRSTSYKDKATLITPSLGHDIATWRPTLDEMAYQDRTLLSLWLWCWYLLKICWYLQHTGVLVGVGVHYHKGIARDVFQDGGGYELGRKAQLARFFGMSPGLHA